MEHDSPRQARRTARDAAPGPPVRKVTVPDLDFLARHGPARLAMSRGRYSGSWALPDDSALPATDAADRSPGRAGRHGVIRKVTPLPPVARQHRQGAARAPTLSLAPRGEFAEHVGRQHLRQLLAAARRVPQVQRHPRRALGGEEAGDRGRAGSSRRAATTPALANAAPVASRSIATLSLTLQVRHQSAVNQTNTGLPEARASASAASLKGSAGMQAGRGGGGARLQCGSTSAANSTSPAIASRPTAAADCRPAATGRSGPAARPWPVRQRTRQSRTGCRQAASTATAAPARSGPSAPPSPCGRCPSTCPASAAASAAAAPSRAAGTAAPGPGRARRTAAALPTTAAAAPRPSPRP